MTGYEKENPSTDCVIAIVHVTGRIYVNKD